MVKPSSWTRATCAATSTAVDPSELSTSTVIRCPSLGAGGAGQGLLENEPGAVVYNALVAALDAAALAEAR